MPRKPNHQFERRKREQRRAERATERRNRKLERAAAAGEPSARRGADDEDPDLAGIVVGPQPRDEVSDEEARRAIQRAMNPGQILPGDEPRVERSSKLFVGNLDFGATEDELRQLFSEAGFIVTDATIVRDRATGQARGFAFVEVQGVKEAARAVSQLDGAELGGRPLRLSVADKPRR